MVRDNHHQSIQSPPIDLLDELKDPALQVRIETLEEEKRRLVEEVNTAHQLNDSSSGVAKKNYDHALKPLAEGDEELDQAVIDDLNARERKHRPVLTGPVPPTQALNPPFDMDLLRVHFGDHLPGFVTETHCRSLKWKKWLRFLNIDVDTADAVDSLTLANDLDLRIHGTEDLFFVYRPIFLEEKPCFIDWSSKEVNQRIHDYLIKRESDEKPLHIFVLPQSKKNWSYVGAHQIRVLETGDPSLWARLSNSVKCWLSEFLRCTEM
ncbi:hypothetical protein IW261DRAFT_1434123 [Armillaria novae-zelandiae]|uniref:Uncharacterized protein n=1 Tax=Armillaria novae-zelandiae TaxID=153914 RepID=A0AA39PW87_9AGAR|nr:hypothetical protein IW261DRAFT_1434123 [Armillaria novae-zelandiae]